MNQVNLIGRLTRDVVVATGEGGAKIARFSLAINEGYGDKARTNYPNIVVFGKSAENCEKYLAKGRLVAVSGRIQTGSYQNKDGNTVYTTDVVANHVEFLEWGEKNGTPSSTEEVPEGFNVIDDEPPF